MALKATDFPAKPL